MNRILIFGAGGFTGGRLVLAAQRAGWQVTAPSRNLVDITEPHTVSRRIKEERPDVVVNAAAMAGIDRAEINQAEAYQVNTSGAVNIARSCAELGSKHIFFSSDAVFDGTAAICSEDASTNPLNYYGFTKAEAERQITEINSGAVILRVALILGFPVAGGNSYLAGTQRRLQAGETVPAPRDEIRTPVDIHTLCTAVLELTQSAFSGILHLGALESINRYDLTCQIATRLGFDTKNILPDPSLTGRALRHKNGILSVQRAQQVLRTPMLPLEQTMERAFLNE